MMYRPKSSTLSILERAQGQLSGKRFGKKTSTWSHQKDEPNEEEDELKAYLSQLQKRTTKPVLSDDISDDSDEVYQPKTSTPLKSGSQFLKSNRANKPSPAADGLAKNSSKQATIKEGRSIQNGGKAAPDISESSSDISSVSEEQLGIKVKAARGRERTEYLSNVSAANKQQDIPKRTYHGRATPAGSKSAAYNRIMSNLGSDEDDVMDMINSIESNSSSQNIDVPVKAMEGPTKNENTSVNEQPVKAASPLPQSISQRTSSPVPEEIEEIASISEVIPTDASSSSQGEIKLNIFQAQDLLPAVASEEDQHQTVIRDKVNTDKSIRKGDDVRRPSGKQAWLEEDVKKETNTEDPVSRSEAAEEIDSDVESDINTVSELKHEPAVESDRTQSDEDTDIIASSYSSIASHRWSTSTSRSSKASQDSRRSSESVVSTRRTTPRNARFEKHSTAKQSSYSEDFHSDTFRSRSVSSSETLTPTSGAAPEHSPTPPVTPSPVPKKTRTHRVKDKGIQTSNVPYNQNHWVFDHGPPGRSVDVSELTRDFKTTSVAPETLHALSSINYTSLLLHQTLKMQFQQTQQSVDRMLQIHQSLLESVQSDYTYTTLEDTKAYIKRQRENGKR